MTEDFLWAPGRIHCEKLKSQPPDTHSLRAAWGDDKTLCHSGVLGRLLSLPSQSQAYTAHFQILFDLFILLHLYLWGLSADLKNKVGGPKSE